MDGELDHPRNPGRRPSDIGALVSLYDLIVLNDQLPAFNY
jgi:hypothetical protein